MAAPLYIEKYRRYRVYVKYLDDGPGRPETDWWLTESFDDEQSAIDRAAANMRAAYRPKFEIWKYEDSLKDGKDNIFNKKE